MNFSKLSQSEKIAAVAALVVIVTALISIAWDLGLLMAVPLLAGIAVLAVVFQPQMAPTMSLPGSRGSLLVTVGVIAAAATVITALNYVGYITRNLVDIDTLQFLLGLVAAVVMAWSGWQVFQAEGGKFMIGRSGPSGPTAG